MKKEEEKNEAEQQNSLCCSVQLHPMLKCIHPIAVKHLDSASSNLKSVDLFSHWFQIFLICGKLIDGTGRRYKYILNTHHHMF